MKIIKINLDIVVSNDEEFCSNGIYGTQRSACKYLGTKKRENECRLFLKILNFKYDIPERCNECKYS